MKTKNFHWHVSGPHFRDYHLLLDEQAEQIFATTDDIAERVRKIGGTHAALDRPDRQAADASRTTTRALCRPHDMLRELMGDNKAVVASMRECHEVAEKHEDVATASLLENFIDEAERRTWFLFEASRAADCRAALTILCVGAAASSAGPVAPAMTRSDSGSRETLSGLSP